jgi:hypothetical protein
MSDDGNGSVRYIDNWYGANGRDQVGGSEQRYPMVVVPPEGQGNAANSWSQLKHMDWIRNPSQLSAFYDGVWFHNAAIRRVAARHFGRTQTNVSLFDGSVEGFVTEVEFDPVLYGSAVLIRQCKDKRPSIANN